MPQMSPMMWFLLFIMFTIVLILFNQMNFFTFKLNPLKSKSSPLTKKMKFNWKW
uniref:ATP synthase complex subunit 8 n=2 Tax=Acridoidea TaxID=92621 RepID=A0A6G6A6S6_9ORTH|nr:ATP synthase F0 subunit 8 [Conophymacris viridis]YP_009740592.1 ATP synthase F0 subunit 8 [Xiangelilacris zhongdianensis]QID03476.1 ATP synthase F0 subunit 8 [Conophymacris viridis]QID03554.1 ATP synthase F0 subunit 8 [Xiangelilacris zhongdianensis]